MEHTNRNTTPPGEEERDPVDFIGETLMNLLSLAQMLQRSPQKLLSPPEFRQPQGVPSLATGSFMPTQTLSNKESSQISATVNTESKCLPACFICLNQKSKVCGHVHEAQKPEEEQQTEMERKEIKENHADLQEHRPLVSKKHPSATTESYQNPPMPVMPGVKNQDSSDTTQGAKPLKANNFKDRSNIHVKQPSSSRCKEDKSIVCDSTASSRSKKTPKPDKTGRKLDRRKR